MSDGTLHDKLSDPKGRAGRDLTYYDALAALLAESPFSATEKLQNFTKYVPRQYLTYFLVRYELFRKVLNVHGSIVECGVFAGGGLMAFAQLSAIFEPVNHQRRIIGFDSFEGFGEMSAEDRTAEATPEAKAGGMASHAYDELRAAIGVFDRNRSIPQIPKVELVKGDATETIPDYLSANPHLIISLLYLDFDVYEPTKVALKHLAGRVPKGGIIAFDEANIAAWPGETVAMEEILGIRNLRLERFPFDSHGCYAVVE